MGSIFCTPYTGDNVAVHPTPEWKQVGRLYLKIETAHRVGTVRRSLFFFLSDTRFGFQVGGYDRFGRNPLLGPGEVFRVPNERVYMDHNAWVRTEIAPATEERFDEAYSCIREWPEDTSQIFELLASGGLLLEEADRLRGWVAGLRKMLSQVGTL